MAYNKDTADKIVAMYSSGKFLNAIGNTKGMPCRDTIQIWRKSYKDFGQRMDNALDAHCESLLAIVHDAVTAATTITEAKIAEAKFRYISWLVGRLHRKQYGDKIDVVVEHRIDIGPLLAKRLKHITAPMPELIEEANIAG